MPEYLRAYCPHCRDYRRAERPGFNHLLHLLVTTLLCGFWLPVWYLRATAYIEPYRCPQCGTNLSSQSVTAPLPPASDPGWGLALGVAGVALACVTLVVLAVAAFAPR